MKNIIIILLFSMFLISSCFAQVDSLPVKHNIKLGLPIWYKGFLSDWYSVGLQYERLLSAKNSLSLGISYYDSDRKRSTTSGTIEHYKQVMILPQWRHYLRKKEGNYFNGFYLGASAVYLRDYIDRIENRENRHIMGLGVLIGYQQVIKKRLSIGLTPALHFGVENININKGNPNRRLTSTIFITNLDFHIGYIF